MTQVGLTVQFPPDEEKNAITRAAESTAYRTPPSSIIEINRLLLQKRLPLHISPVRRLGSTVFLPSSAPLLSSSGTAFRLSCAIVREYCIIVLWSVAVGSRRFGIGGATARGLKHNFPNPVHVDNLFRDATTPCRAVGMVTGPEVISSLCACGSSAARPAPVRGYGAMRVTRFFILILGFRNSDLREIFDLASAFLRLANSDLRALRRVCGTIANGAVTNLHRLGPVLCVHAC